MDGLRRYALVALALALVVGATACSEDVDPRIAACADYCELTMRNCTGDVAQYTAGDTCQATCRAMPLGDPASPTGNTISCRTFQAALAENTMAAACTRAGPGGDGGCGDNCDSFCTLALELCSGRPDSYPDFDTCRTTCSGFSQVEPYDANEIDGDTFACRLYHLTAASTQPDIHCAHIGAVSPVCL
jgi:hypothetical protein